MQQLQAQPEQPPHAEQARQPRPQPRQPPQRAQPRCAYCTPGSRGSAISRSKTKNVPRLTSAISSSLKVISGACAVSFTSVVVATVPAAAALPASATDTPTAPATGTARFNCLCLVRDIMTSPG